MDTSLSDINEVHEIIATMWNAWVHQSVNIIILKKSSVLIIN